MNEDNNEEKHEHRHRHEGGDEAELAESFDNQTAKALATLVYDVIEVPAERAKFMKDPIGTARAAGVPITDKTTNLINSLHAMGEPELVQLGKLNHTLIDYGVYVETGNPPMMVF